MRDVQGVSTRKVKAITEELCGHAFSASSISRINQSLDEELQPFKLDDVKEALKGIGIDGMRYALAADRNAK